MSSSWVFPETSLYTGTTDEINGQWFNLQVFLYPCAAATAAVKLLQSCLTLCDPIDGSPPGSPVPAILQARTLEWVAISFSNAWKWKVKVKSLRKWKVKVKSLSRVRLVATPWTAAYRLLRPWDFLGKSAGVACHCRLSHSVKSDSVNLCSLSMGFSQARILEWVVISSSRGSSQLRDQTHVSCISCVSCIAGLFFTPEEE